MEKIFIESLLHILIILPMMILFMKKKTKINLQRILIFTLVYIVYYMLISIPNEVSFFDFIKSRWNWDGKIIGIIWAVVSYYLFKNYFLENNYFTIKQNKNGFKHALVAGICIVVLSTVIWFLSGDSDFNIDTLTFQLTLPGIDEELIFRGILLGLLMTSMKNNIFNPSILLTSILFGFMHALSISDNYSLNFNSIYFIQTGFAGYIWGWITVKSKSLLLAILSHNFSNFFGTLSTMIK